MDIITNKSDFQNGWTGGLPETVCGAGSKLRNTADQREFLTHVIKRYNIGSIADIGAGDLNWISKTDLCGATYRPYDLYPRADSVMRLDITQETIPPVDLIICFWVLNHLPYDDCQKAIDNIKNSGSKYLMMTDRESYRDIQPPDINMAYIEILTLNEQKKDHIKLIQLETI